MNNQPPTPTEVFRWIRAHKGHPIEHEVHYLRERIRERKRNAYDHDKAALECKDWRERAKHEDWATKIREVFIPAMQDKFNQIIKGQ